MSASAPRPRPFDELYAEICALPEGKTGMIASDRCDFWDSVAAQ